MMSQKKREAIDDKIGEVRSIIEIYKGSDGKYYGKVAEIFLKRSEEANPVCRKSNSNDLRYNQPILGILIINGLKKEGSEYKRGKILDTKTSDE